MKKRIFPGILALVMMLITTACGAGERGGASTADFAPIVSAPMPPPATAAPGVGAMSMPQDTFRFLDGSTAGTYQAWNLETQADATSTNRERMIIQTGRMSLRSEPEDFDNTVAALRQLPEEKGGFIEASSLENFENWRGAPESRFSITIRVPVGRFGEAMEAIGGLAELVSRSSEAEDITDAFYDMAGRTEMRRLEETRILELIDDAHNIDQLLELERRLRSVRNQIEMYQAQMSGMAARAAYSTIFVTLAHIPIDAPPPQRTAFTERMAQAFGSSADGTLAFFQGLVVVAVGLVIPLVFLGLIGIIVFLVIKSARKRKQRT